MVMHLRQEQTAATNQETCAADRDAHALSDSVAHLHRACPVRPHSTLPPLLRPILRVNKVVARIRKVVVSLQGHRAAAIADRDPQVRRRPGCANEDIAVAAVAEVDDVGAVACQSVHKKEGRGRGGG